MPRQKSLVTVIREFVREEVDRAIQGLLGGAGKATRRRRRRGPGRPPGSKNKRRGPGRPLGSKNKTSPRRRTKRRAKKST